MRIQILITAIVLSGQFTFGQRFAFAQIAVQQPVVGVTSVNTTVSVPDRGTTYLGGVSSFQAGRSQYGPLRSGTSMGYSAQSSSMSASVYIHDLRAMDEAILNSVGRTSDGSAMIGGNSGRISQPNPASETTASPAEKRKKFEELALKSEAAGKANIAKLHWQMAAKFGSSQAERRLAELANTPTAPSTKTIAQGSR